MNLAHLPIGLFLQDSLAKNSSAHSVQQNVSAVFLAAMSGSSSGNGISDWAYHGHGRHQVAHLLRDPDLLLRHLLELPRQVLHLQLDALQLVQRRQNGPRLAHTLQVDLAH